MYVKDFIKSHIWDTSIDWIDTNLLTTRINLIHGNAKIRPDRDVDDLHLFVNTTVITNKYKYKPLLDNLTNNGGYTWAEDGESNTNTNATSNTTNEQTVSGGNNISNTTTQTYGRTDTANTTNTAGGNDTVLNTGTQTNANDVFAYDSSTAQHETSSTRTDNLSSKTTYGRTDTVNTTSTAGGTDSAENVTEITNAGTTNDSGTRTDSGTDKNDYTKHGYNLNDLINTTADLINIYDDLAHVILRDIISPIYTSTPDFNLDW